MYKAVKNDNGEYIGYGGIGVLTSGLVNTLNVLSFEGPESARYFLVNVSTGEYISTLTPRKPQQLPRNNSC